MDDFGRFWGYIFDIFDRCLTARAVGGERKYKMFKMYKMFFRF